MKYLMLFESFVKKYEQSITKEDFKSLKKDQEIIYLGTSYIVETPGEYVILLKNKHTGNTVKVNYNMFNRNAMIPEKD